MNSTILFILFGMIALVTASFPLETHDDLSKEITAELAGERNDGIPDRGKRSYGSGHGAYGGQLDGILYGMLLQKLIAPPPAAAPAREV